MTESLLFLDPHSGLSLQTQIRQHLVDAILKGAFPRGSRLPSSRRMAEQLGVARNTVVLAYEQLIEEGYLETRQRSGVFVNEHIRENRIGLLASPRSDAALDALWSGRIRAAAENKPQFQWPANWQQHPYPFMDGYFDASLYPTAQWREASRMALGTRLVSEGTVTEGDADDPVLIERSAARCCRGAGLPPARKKSSSRPGNRTPCTC